MGICCAKDDEYYSADVYDFTKTPEKIEIFHIGNIHAVRYRINDENRIKLIKHILEDEERDYNRGVLWKNIDPAYKLCALRKLLTCDEQIRKKKFNSIIENVIYRILDRGDKPDRILKFDYSLIIEVYPRKEY